MKLFDKRMMATLDSRLRSCSTIAFTKCVVPIVRHAIRFLSTLDFSRTVFTAASIPFVTFGLEVGVLYCARMPRNDVEERLESSITASL